MLTEICAEIKNYFVKKEDIILGDFIIIDGSIVPSVGLVSGQYYRIVGSVFNDGVHASTDELTNEPEFHGAIWKMRVPQDVIKLAEEIEAWQSKYGALDSQAMSPYQSESFGGYAYSKGSTSNDKIGVSWKDQNNFISRLNQYRRIRVL